MFSEFIMFYSVRISFANLFGNLSRKEAMIILI